MPPGQGGRAEAPPRLCAYRFRSFCLSHREAGRFPRRNTPLEIKEAHAPRDAGLSDEGPGLPADPSCPFVKETRPGPGAAYPKPTAVATPPPRLSPALRSLRIRPCAWDEGSMGEVEGAGITSSRCGVGMGRTLVPGTCADLFPAIANRPAQTPRSPVSFPRKREPNERYRVR